MTHDSRRSAGSPRRDHRSHRSQDGHQRAELRRESVHGGLRRLAHADVGQRRAGPDQPARCGRSHHQLQQSRRQAVPLNPQIATLLVRPRGWHLYEKHILRRRQAGARCVRRLRPVPVPQPCCAEGARHGPYFYLPKLESHLEARLWADVFRLLRAEARHRAAVDQGHGADRDDPRRVRDGRDPVRAEGLHRRPQLRPLGLHLQLHQEIQPTAGLRAAGSPAGDDDDALPALVFEARDQDLPSPRRVRDGRHGAADSDQERSAGERGSARAKCAPTRSAKPATVTMAPGSRIRAWCRSRWKCSIV